MYFRDLIASLRRRWYLVLAGLLVTAGLALAAIPFVPVTYTSTVSMLLLPPQSVLGSRGNPYMYLGGLTQALEVLSARVNASDSAEALLGAHPDVTVVVGPDTTTAGPILLVSSTADSPNESIEVRDQLARMVPGALESMQNDLEIRPSSRITVSLLASDRKPIRDIKNPLRAVIAIVAVGVAITVLGVGYLDYLVAMRKGVVVRPRRQIRLSDSGTNGESDVPASAAISVTAEGNPPADDATVQMAVLDTALADEQVAAAAVAEPPQESKGANGWQISFLTAPLVYPHPSPEDDELDWTWERLDEPGAEASPSSATVEHRQPHQDNGGRPGLVPEQADAATAMSKTASNLTSPSSVTLGHRQPHDENGGLVPGQADPADEPENASRWPTAPWNG